MPGLCVFSAAIKKRLDRLKGRGTVITYEAKWCDASISQWLKDAPQRLKNERKRSREL